MEDEGRAKEESTIIFIDKTGKTELKNRDFFIEDKQYEFKIKVVNKVKLNIIKDMSWVKITLDIEGDHFEATYNHILSSEFPEGYDCFFSTDNRGKIIFFNLNEFSILRREGLIKDDFPFLKENK